MKVKLFTAKEFPPTTLFNPNTRTQVPVLVEPHEKGWLVETEDLDAASSSIKDFGYLLVEPESLQFPQVPNFEGHFKASDFKFKAATPEEIAAGKYLSWPEQKKAERLAGEEVKIEKFAPPPATDEEIPATDAEAPVPETSEETAEESAPATDEADELRAKLTAAGIPFHPQLGIKKLQALVAAIPPAVE